MSAHARLLSWFFAVPIVLMLAGCPSSPPATPSHYVEVQEPDPVIIQGCCETTYSVHISGGASAAGAYHWLGIEQHGVVRKSGEPIFLSGNYSDRELSVTVGYRDQVPAGTYSVRAFATAAFSEVGSVAAKVAAAEVAYVNIPAYDAMTCFECDTLEITYRSFIYCDVISGFPASWSGYYSGDHRDFGYQEDSRFRSSQIIKAAYRFDTQAWTFSSGHVFGVTFEWSSEWVNPNAYPGSTCPARFVEPGPSPNDAECGPLQAQAGVGGSQQTEVGIYVEPGGSLLDVDLVGCNPCVGPQSCCIDGHFLIGLGVEMVNGLPTAIYRLSGRHDGYPWHELYIKRLVNRGYFVPAYTWDASNQGIASLCYIFDPEGEITHTEDEWTFVP